uniref:Lysine-rich arabinogalactan protein 19-like n=1 Tax=Phascolarctos cinereus TaxID=38626 RepID=A0A6P5JHM8_PHACI|nr:lysine-rich arabinogalactan protein 19-like [Phascolarctos cinereus]
MAAPAPTPTRPRPHPATSGRCRAPPLQPPPRPSPPSSPAHPTIHHVLQLRLRGRAAFCRQARAALTTGNEPLPVPSGMAPPPEAAVRPAQPASTTRALAPPPALLWSPPPGTPWSSATTPHLQSLS